MKLQSNTKDGNKGAVNKFKKKEIKMEVDSDHEEFEETKKVKGSGKFHKEGKLLKKKKKTIFNRWDERYLILKDNFIYFYNEKPKSKDEKP